MFISLLLISDGRNKPFESVEPIFKMIQKVLKTSASVSEVIYDYILVFVC